MGQTPNRSLGPLNPSYIATDVTWVIPRNVGSFDIQVPIENNRDDLRFEIDGCDVAIADIRTNGYVLSVTVPLAVAVGQLALKVITPGGKDNSLLQQSLASNQANRIEVIVGTVDDFEVIGDDDIDFRKRINDLYQLQTTQLTNNDPSIFADGDKGEIDPLGVSGWYYTNSATGKKINWYFYGSTPTVTETKGDVKSIWALVTIRSIDSLPFIQLYTKRENDGNDAGSWYRSRITYTYQGAALPVPPVGGTQYLMYVGDDPGVFGTVPRLELTRDAVSSIGPEADSEEILTMVFASNSAAAAGEVEFVATELGYVGKTAHAYVLYALNAGTPIYDQRFAGTDPAEQQVTSTTPVEVYDSGPIAVVSGKTYDVNFKFEFQTQSISRSTTIRAYILGTDGVTEIDILNLENEAKDTTNYLPVSFFDIYTSASTGFVRLKIEMNSEQNGIISRIRRIAHKVLRVT